MREIHSDYLHAIYHPRKGGVRGPKYLSYEAAAPVRQIHCTWSGYVPTPLVPLNALAEKLGVKGIFVKNESKRFGLNAFKGLGGLYALARVVCRELDLDFSSITFEQLRAPELQEKIRNMVFVTATDGNHGKGVAWAAGLLGCRSYIYMPAGSSEHRAEAIRRAGKATVEIMPFGYDDAVRHAAHMAKIHGWHLVQDTNFPGYEEVPAWIMQGYTTMAEEALCQLQEAGFDAPTHVFLQAGVGSMAGSVAGYLANRCKNVPTFGVVEPDTMACFYYSALDNDGEPHPARNTGDTIMAGLNCGEPCSLAWDILKELAQWYITCPDSVTKDGMRLLANPLPGDTPVISGESGAVTTGLLHMLMTDASCRELRDALGLNKESVVLLFSTEGDTDPVSYQSIIRGEM